LQRLGWAKSNPHSEDAGAPKAACPRAGGEECEHPAGGVYCGAAVGGRVGHTKARSHEEMKSTMARKDISEAKDPAMRGSLAAMRRAAALAREIAIQTNTAIVVFRDGKVVRISAAELRAGKN
jgi:hypothetical protein